MLGVAGFARGTAALTLLLVLAGVGNGAGQPASNALIASAVSERRQALAFGVKQAAIPLSTLLAGVAIPVIAIPLGWRSAFVLAGVLALAVVLAVPRAEADATSAPRRPTEASGPFHLLPLLVLSAGVLLAAASGNALGAFFVASAVAAGTEPGTAGLLAAAADLAGVGTRILLGWLADRAHARWLVVVVAQMAVRTLAYVAVAGGQPLVMTAGAVVELVGRGMLLRHRPALAQAHAEGRRPRVLAP